MQAQSVRPCHFTILPRVDKLWYKYVWMEEMLGDIPKDDDLCLRGGWSWEPDEAAWSAIHQAGEALWRIPEGARGQSIQRFTIVHPESTELDQMGQV